MLKYLLKLFFFPRRESYLLPSEISLSILNKATIPANHLSPASSMLAHQVQGESWSSLLREVMRSPSVEKHQNPTGHGPEEPALEILLWAGSWPRGLFPLQGLGKSVSLLFPQGLSGYCVRLGHGKPWFNPVLSLRPLVQLWLSYQPSSTSVSLVATDWQQRQGVSQ